MLFYLCLLHTVYGCNYSKAHLTWLSTMHGGRFAKDAGMLRLVGKCTMKQSPDLKNVLKTWQKQGVSSTGNFYWDVLQSNETKTVLDIK